ncbi:MAG TPA: hypothetical protein PKO06_22720 [Candidatus Ozemobacteraceae bacterium]|nr:hypothetical protein [Candidatus Ozemobacteraceae bacterium]
MKAIRLFTFFLLVAISGHAASIGVIDLDVALSFHPLMSTFDFHHGRFLRVTPGTPEAERQQRILSIRETARHQEPALDAQIASLNQTLSALEQQRSLLMGMTTASETASVHARELDLHRLAQKAEQYREQRDDLALVRQYPEMTSASETLAMINRIEQEVHAALIETAQAEQLEVILNAADIDRHTPVGSPERDQPKRSFLESDLYNRFMGQPTPQDPLDRAASQQLPWRWLQSSRYHRTLPPHWRSYPLVLHGGKDVTVTVVERVFRQYACAPEAVRLILEEIRQWRGDQNRDRK